MIKRTLFILPLVATGLFFTLQNGRMSAIATSYSNYQSAGSIKVEGFVSIDSKPCIADVDIVSTQRPRAFRKSFKSDSNGIYRTELPTGDEFEIVVRAKAFPQQVIFINTPAVKSDSTLNIYADFISPEYDKKIVELKKEIEAEALARNKKFSEAMFARNYGSVEMEGLNFRVQVGAFRFFENFNYNEMIGMPKIIRKTGVDGITRFTMGNFKTYSEAMTFLKVVKKNQLREAFVVAFYNDERKLISQLEEENILVH